MSPASAGLPFASHEWLSCVRISDPVTEALLAAREGAYSRLGLNLSPVLMAMWLAGIIPSRVFTQSPALVGGPSLSVPPMHCPWAAEPTLHLPIGLCPLHPCIDAVVRGKSGWGC